MSTILDSLKKSSNKRDDNNKTSIDSFNFSSANNSSKLGLLMVLFLILTAVAISYFGYEYLKNRVDAKSSPEIELSKSQNLPQEAINNVVSTTQDKKAAPRKIQKPDNEAVRNRLKQNQVTQPIKKELAQLKQPAKTPQKIDSKPNVKLESATKSDVKNPISTKPDIKLSMPDQSKNQKKPEPEIKKEVVKPEYVYVYQLPFSIRKEMPKFKLNIHIYDENTENQVAVINGVKFAVGDLIEDQVLIKSIVREGVLLEFNGHVFLLPNL